MWTMIVRLMWIDCGKLLEYELLDRKGVRDRCVRLACPHPYRGFLLRSFGHIGLVHRDFNKTAGED